MVCKYKRWNPEVADEFLGKVTVCSVYRICTAPVVFAVRRRLWDSQYICKWWTDVSMLIATVFHGPVLLYYDSLLPRFQCLSYYVIYLYILVTTARDAIGTHSTLFLSAGFLFGSTYLRVILHVRLVLSYLLHRFVHLPDIPQDHYL